MRKELENAKIKFKASLKDKGSFDSERNKIIESVLRHIPNWNLKIILHKY